MVAQLELAPVTKKQKKQTADCALVRNWLEWLFSADVDCFHRIWGLATATSYHEKIGPYLPLEHTYLRRANMHALMKHMTPPPLFYSVVRKALKSYFGWRAWTCKDDLSDLEMSKLYLRWQTRRYPQLLEPRFIGRVGNGVLYDCDRHRFLYGIEIWSCPYVRKWQIEAIASDNNITVRRSWTKARMWRELLRAGPRAEPRFDSYLVHSWKDGRLVTGTRRC
jgi:hypothetical protein